MPYGIKRPNPPDNQRVIFKASIPLPTAWQWKLDNKVSQNPVWFPLPGKHTLQLLDAQGREVDRVDFEVRGAMLKPTAMR